MSILTCNKRLERLKGVRAVMGNIMRYSKWLNILMFIISLNFILINFYNKDVYAQINPTTEKIDLFIKEKMKENSIPGLVVAVTHNDKIILSKGYGVTGISLTIYKLIF